MSAREPTLLLQVTYRAQTPLLVLVAVDDVSGPRLCSCKLDLYRHMGRHWPGGPLVRRSSYRKALS